MNKKICSNTVIYTMRIVGSIIMLSAIGLVAYMAWITSHVGLDVFLIAAFGVGIVSIIVAALLIYFSFRIVFEESNEIKSEEVNRKRKEYIISRKCG